VIGSAVMIDITWTELLDSPDSLSNVEEGAYRDR
jgi:hypothetical protein